MPSIPPLSPEQREWELEGHIEIDGVKMPQYSELVFTGNAKQLEQCREHIEAGDVAEAENDFHLFECRTPEMGEAQIIRYRIECPGAKAGKCAVRVVQYDQNGDKIS